MMGASEHMPTADLTSLAGTLFLESRATDIPAMIDGRGCTMPPLPADLPVAFLPTVGHPQFGERATFEPNISPLKALSLVIERIDRRIRVEHASEPIKSAAVSVAWADGAMEYRTAVIR